MELDYDQVKILESDTQLLKRDNPQRALFENVERAADLAQVKINVDTSSAPQDVRASENAGAFKYSCHS